MQSPDLTLELRAAKPVASTDLRERVRAVAARQAPARRHFLLPPPRRLALIAVPAAIAVAVSGALVHGLATSGRETPKTAARTTTAADGGSVGAIERAPSVTVLSPGATPRVLGAPTTPGRLQQYGASLRIQVNDRDALSDATKRATRVARLLGGYVGAVQYSAPRHGRGSAFLVVRVPIDRVQDALEEYSALGTLIAQKVRITDVTKAVTEQAKEIARLKLAIARLEGGGVTAAERLRLGALKERLEYLTKRRAATVRRAELARIALTLVTKPKHAAAAPGRFERTMSDAGDVLLREAEILLYALIVAGPLLLLGAGIIAAGRVRDRRLFERS